MDQSTINTIGNVGMGFQVFGAVQSRIGSYYSAQMQKSSLQFQAEMQQINARIMEGQAQAESAASPVLPPRSAQLYVRRDSKRPSWRSPASTKHGKSGALELSRQR